VLDFPNIQLRRKKKKPITPNIEKEKRYIMGEKKRRFVGDLIQESRIGEWTKFMVTPEKEV